VDVASANSAILSAQNAIASARASGKNVTAAEALLTQARTALSAGNYENARNLAVQAQNTAVTAPQLPAAPLLEIIVAIVVIIVAGVGITLLLKRRKVTEAAPTMTMCVVCGEPTTLHTRCSSCGQYACIKHLQTIAGRPYCSNCVRKMYGQT
jgi:ribosomal protein L32